MEELLASHIREHYADTLGLNRSAGFAVSPADPTGRRFAIKADGVTKVIDCRIVGGRNSGYYRGWVTLPAGGKRRVDSARPSGYESYTLMVGATPDDEAIWWSALYNDDLLSTLPWEEREDGRWWRLAPDEAKPALVVPIVDVFQQTLDLESATPSDDADARSVVAEELVGAIQTATDHSQYDHLSADQLESIGQGLVDAGQTLLTHAIMRWRDQSYSRQKAKAKK